MKIVQINICFRLGSTGKIVAAIHDELMRRSHESYVIYSIANDKIENNTFPISNKFLNKWWGRIARFLGLRFECAYFETYKAIRLLKRIKPDIVHIHCLNNYYINPRILFRYLSKSEIKVLITNHADINFTANCDCAFDCIRWKTGCGNCPYDKGNFHSRFFDLTNLSWKIFNKRIRSIKELHLSSVSEFTHLRALESPFFENSKSNRIICNGIDSNLFKYNSGFASNKKKTVIYVTPNISDSNKGFNYVVELATINPDIIFWVVGAETYNGAPSNIIFKSKVNDPQILAQYYSEADISLLASRQESFSLVCAESLCCGTPVVGFKAGAPETIALKEYSCFVDYGDVEALNCALHHVLMKNYNREIISKIACERYDIHNMVSSYIDFYSDITQE